MRTIPAGQFKATCLAVMDEVKTKRQSIIVTKNGEPVVKMVPLDLPEKTDPLDSFYFGKIEIVGDIFSSPYSDEEWEGFERSSPEPLK